MLYKSRLKWPTVVFEIEVEVEVDTEVDTEVEI